MELGAEVGHQLLVRGDNRLAGKQRPVTQSYAGWSPPTTSITTSASETRISSTDSVQHTDAGTQSARLRGDVAIENVREAARHLAAAENARDRLSDRPKAEQRHAVPAVDPMSFSACRTLPPSPGAASDRLTTLTRRTRSRLLPAPSRRPPPSSGHTALDILACRLIGRALSRISGRRRAAGPS